MESEDKDAKLRQAKKFFQDAVDHTREAHAEAHRAEKYYHNTRCEGQWEAGDIAYLRDQGRPVISLNITKDKVDSFIGMYGDAQRVPRVMGTGAEDQLQAEVMDHVSSQWLQDASYERKAAGQLKTGTIAGECGLQVEIGPSSKGRGWIELSLHRIMPFELHWDAASIEADRSDARHVFWDRWMGKEEFQDEYPEHKNEWSQLSNSSDETDINLNSSWSELGEDGFGDSLEDYDGDQLSRYYFDRQKHKVRVIRYEYKTFVTKTYATNLMTGDRAEIGDEQRERLELAASMGFGDQYEVEEVKEEVVKVCEFIGSKILAEYDSPGPFDGFSIVPYTYMIDEEDGTAYGLVRNLFDPQMELNKSKSLELEYMAQTTAPGTIAEVGALVDEEQFSAEVRRPGGVALVKDGALGQGKVVQREPGQPSLAIVQRAASAMELIDRISGIPSSGQVQPASQAEAATTVALRYHKSRQIVQDPISNYENAQHEVVRRVVEAISRSMPDDQIQAMLANDARYRVEGGVVVEMASDPDNPQQQIPKQRALLRDLRRLDWNIELEHSTENSTLRMMEFDMLLKLMQANVPVDPEVLVEVSTGSRSQRERLKAYVEKAQRSGAIQLQQEAQMFQQQMQQAFAAQMADLEEKSRHNRASEMLDAKKSDDKINVELWKIWEQADEAEKARFDAYRLAREKRVLEAGGY